MPLELAVQIAMGCAAGLHHAHEQTDSKGRPLNIVHRDVSPSNVLVTHHSGVKLIDFGIATAQSRREQTSVGTLKGKAGYMSPEQCRGKTLDRRSDLFALGILMYEMTTLVRPFEGESHLAVMHQICTEDPVPPSKIRRDYPEGLERVVMRALQKDPDKRHQTAFALLEELERVTRDSTLHALPGALARYLEHLFGPRAHPWQADGGTKGSDRRDLDTTQTGREPPRASTSTITQPNVAKEPEPDQPEATESPGETTAAAAEALSLARGGPRRARVTEPALVAMRDDDASPSGSASVGRSSSMVIVAGAVVAAAAIVMVAAQYSSRTPAVAPREAAAVRQVAQANAAPVTVPVAPDPKPARTQVAPALARPEPTTDPEVVIGVAEDEPPPSPRARPPTAAKPGKKDPASRTAEAARLLTEARTQSFHDKKKAMVLTRESLSTKRTAEAYALLGLLACKLGDAATAKEAYRNLSEKRRLDLKDTCARGNIDLE